MFVTPRKKIRAARDNTYLRLWLTPRQGKKARFAIRPDGSPQLHSGEFWRQP